jgi:hypothetical protein
MIPVLDEPRLSYANRKVRRLREDVETWQAQDTPQAGPGAWEDLIRDANRLAQDLFALDRLALEASASTANGDASARPVAAEIAEWATTANRLIGAVGEMRGGEVEGLEELREHLETARLIAAADPTERVFRTLARAWKEETYYLSSTTAMTNHWAYQKIIRLGPPVVPLLLRELRSKPDFWFAALRALTGANPVAPEDAGKVRAMANAWVKWGEANHLL